MGQSDWWYSDSGQADGQGREPAQRGGHPPTEAAAPVPQGYDQSEHLRRLYGAQAGAPGLRDTEARFSPQALAYGQPGQRHAPPPRKSWPAAHKGATAALSLCAVAAATAAVLALAPSKPATASAAAAGGGPAAGTPAAGGSAPGPVTGGQAGGQPGAGAAVTPSAGVTVTGSAKAGTRKAAGTVTTVTAARGASAAPAGASPSPAPDSGPSSAAAGGGGGTAPVVTGTSPVVVTTSPHTIPLSQSPTPPSTPSITPPASATCTVSGHVPVVQTVVTATTASTATVSVSVREYDAAGMLLETIVISAPAPVAGGTVTADGPASPSLISCQAGGVTEAGN